ncbi:polysaccharide pyruvyl transferase family protein [Prosthecobacter sp. SYSU 5D2]|uniref:polysaccharide pyruvyl transferase family protein n=1 Tax=Prosthecobacter sp. SYSU 5D2 TaxID=3134134 RepID=UPI0031FF3DEC
MNRRQFFTTGAAALACPVFADTKGRPPRILLRPGTYQNGNIGDIAHSPGALRMFETLWPEAEMTLWPRGISPEAKASLEKNFPRLRIVEGEIKSKGELTTPELRAAWKEADFMLHGSAPGFKGGEYLPAWRAAGGKPYGLFGITNDPLSGINGSFPEGGTLKQLRAAIEALPKDHLRSGTRTLLNGASFVFCRDSLSQLYFERQGVASPLAFGPDSTFALHLRDDARAAAYLQEQGLEADRFICVIPRLRYTPSEAATRAAETKGSAAKSAVNERTRKADHEKLRGLIIRWVRETGQKVLACPEMSYEVALAKEELVDPLPEDVKAKVVWRNSYWQPDEAASIYAKAMAVVSCECHSPIIALTNGTPAFYIRQPTDTVKGQMYHDIGAGDWNFEVDETSADELWTRLQPIHADLAQAREKVKTLMAGVQKVQTRMVEAVRASLGA